MEIKVILDDKWINDYEENVASIIKDELNSAVRLAVRSVIKSNMAQVTNKVDSLIKNLIPKLEVK